MSIHDNKYINIRRRCKYGKRRSKIKGKDNPPNKNLASYIQITSKDHYLFHYRTLILLESLKRYFIAPFTLRFSYIVYPYTFSSYTHDMTCIRILMVGDDVEEKVN